MPEPSIERFRTEVYFTDASGIEWEVADARRRPDGRLWKEHAGAADSQLRYFVRRGPHNGSQERPILEVRRYRFAAGETTWFMAEEWQRQLETSELRSRIPRHV